MPSDPPDPQELYGSILRLLAKAEGIKSRVASAALLLRISTWTLGLEEIPAAPVAGADHDLAARLYEAVVTDLAWVLVMPQADVDDVMPRLREAVDILLERCLAGLVARAERELRVHDEAPLAAVLLGAA